MTDVGRLQPLEVVNDLMDHIQIAPFKGPQPLVNFSISVQFDENLSLPRSGCRVWKDLEQQRVITSGSVVQLAEHLPKNWASGFLEDDVPKPAIVFEVFLGTVGPCHLLGEPVGEIKVGGGKMAVRRFDGQSNEGQPEFRDIQNFFWRERLYDRPFIRFHKDRALFFERKQGFSDGGSADAEPFAQFRLWEPISWLKGLIEDRIPDLSDDDRRRFLDLACLVILVLSRQLAHRESLSIPVSPLLNLSEETS